CSASPADRCRADIGRPSPSHEICGNGGAGLTAGERCSKPASRALPERRQLLGLEFVGERLRQLEEVAVHDLIDLVKSEVDAVIGDASLGEIVGADALASIAASDETLARRRFLLLPLLALALEQTRRQHRHRLGTIAVLGA